MSKVTDDLRLTIRYLQQELADARVGRPSRDQSKVREWRKKIRHMVRYSRHTDDDMNLLLECETLFDEILKALKRSTPEGS